jgi:hypothetical protein
MSGFRVLANFVLLLLFGFNIACLVSNLIGGQIVLAAINAPGVAMSIVALLLINRKQREPDLASIPLTTLPLPLAPMGSPLAQWAAQQSRINRISNQLGAAQSQYSSSLYSKALLGAAGSGIPAVYPTPPMAHYQLLQQLIQSGQAQAAMNLLNGIEPDALRTGLQRIAAVLHQFPDPTVPNTMGYRYWVFDWRAGVLRSPQQGHEWEDAELHCEAWEQEDVVRGKSGIHARLVPHDWKAVAPDYEAHHPPSKVGEVHVDAPIVTGLVERFGKYVLGTEGWRAEWVIIRKLHAPSRALAVALKATYPDVEVTYGNR